MTHLETIRAAVIKANPEIKNRFGRPIRLSDIVYALRERIEYKDEELLKLAGGDVCHWNLLDDTLDHQSPETLAFLAQLLG